MPQARFIIVDDGTIRESRDHDNLRPRKRQRLELEDGDSRSDEEVVANYFSIPQLEPDLLVRDAEYYIDDPEADCFVRVEKFLFKVSYSWLYHKFTAYS
jgi:hypothetical protein